MGGDMARTFLGICVLLCFIDQCSSVGDPRCPTTKLKITQVRNGLEWNVSINNECTCSLLQLKLSCPNFKPSKNTDPSIIFKTDDGHCLVNNGQPLHTTESLEFTYEGAKVEFAPFDYWVACS